MVDINNANHLVLKREIVETLAKCKKSGDYLNEG